MGIYKMGGGNHKKVYIGQWKCAVCTKFEEHVTNYITKGLNHSVLHNT